MPTFDWQSLLIIILKAVVAALTAWLAKVG